MDQKVKTFVGKARKNFASLTKAFNALERRERYLVGVGLGCLLTFMTTLSIFHNQVIDFLARLSTRFHDVRFSWLILFIIYIIVSFPPLIGYSVLALFTGMVFGFPGGWPLIASGTLFGSFASFLTFRYLLKERAEALAKKSVKFTAFCETLRQDSFVLLWMIRLCPLPYSLSNAAMSTVPSVEPWKFFVATLCCTPKLFLHIFIGSRLARLSTSKDNATWWANFISVVLALGIGIGTSYVIYNKTMEKARQIQHGETDDQADDFEISGDEEAEAEDQDYENPFSLRN